MSRESYCRAKWIRGSGVPVCIQAPQSNPPPTKQKKLVTNKKLAMPSASSALASACRRCSRMRTQRTNACGEPGKQCMSHKDKLLWKRRFVLAQLANAPSAYIALSSWASLAAPGTSSYAESNSSSREEVVRTLYDDYSATYDNLDGSQVADAFGFPEMRTQLLAMASGNVLEIGVGTGLNMPFYDAKNLESFTGVDISQGMLDVAANRANNVLGGVKDVRLVRADATEPLAEPLARRTFDTVVDTFSLCVIPEPVKALREMRGALNQGGRMLLLEHTKAKNAALGWYQDATADIIAGGGDGGTGKGCRWNDDVEAMLKSVEGVVIERVDRKLGGTVSLIVARAV